jgi:hypothetical protein
MLSIIITSYLTSRSTILVDLLVPKRNTLALTEVSLYISDLSVRELTFSNDNSYLSNSIFKISVTRITRGWLLC